MGKAYSEIDDRLREFICSQHLFFVATAPLSERGHVNASPKGMDTFRILGPRIVAYLDLTGSGVETIAHLKENGRIIILFCAFEGAPKILRLHGRGEPIEPGHPEFESLGAHFPAFGGSRAVIRVALERITDSCGHGIPLYHYEGNRSLIEDWACRKGPEGLSRYRSEKNRSSIDGLPGLDFRLDEPS